MINRINMIESNPKARRPPPRKRSDLVADQMKGWIMSRGLAPGDRLPPERDLIDLFGVSKSTAREALRSLEVQGLVRISTGPPGGAIVTSVTEGRALSLLGNYFYFSNLGLGDIYSVRRVLEPELAASVAGRLDDAQLDRLEALNEECSHQPATRAEEHRQRLVELEFHDLLADATENRLLGFQCRFINAVLRDCIVYRKLYGPEEDRQAPTDEVRPMAASGLDHHQKLMAAFREGDAERARSVMADHMAEAQAHMERLEAVIEALIVDEPSGVTWLAPHRRAGA